tara:strand:+ start:1679 stop:2269 length:591 start_codon:yes stop_codon:yes gene_type:complete
MANYKKTYKKNGEVKLTELTPGEAVDIIDKGAPYKIEEETSQNEGVEKVASVISSEEKEAQLLGSTKEAIALRKATINGQIKLEKNRQKMEIAKIKALETGREKSKKHLAQFSGMYLTILVALFLYATSTLAAEALAVVASIISMVILNLSAIMKSVVEEEEPRDPAEMMSEIIHRTLDKDECAAEAKVREAREEE